jgi:hypothetical protein
MHCRECEELLGAYVEGLLDPHEKDECERHVAACADCRALVEATSGLQGRLQKRAPVAAESSLADSVMERIREREARMPVGPQAEARFLEKLRQWRWSFGMGAVAAVLMLFAILGTPSAQLEAAEIMLRGARAAAGFLSVHLRGKLRTRPADNFSAIDPTLDFVPIELWKEFRAPRKWRVEKPGRVAAMNGSETMLFIRPDLAKKLPIPTTSAFDTQWLHDIADLSRLLKEETTTFKKQGWKTVVSRRTSPAGRKQAVVTIEARSGLPEADYLKNKFFSTADTRRDYVFDEETGLPVSARISLLEGPGRETLLFDLDVIEGDAPLAAELFALNLPAGVAWEQEMQVLPDNEKYAAMTSEQATKAFFEACSRENWNEAAKFCTLTAKLRAHLGGLVVISTGETFTSALSLISGAEFVPYEIRLKDGTVRKHNIAWKRDRKTRRWFLDGGI